MDELQRAAELMEVIEVIAHEKGATAQMDENYYRDFLNLSRGDARRLVFAVVLAHDAEIRRLCRSGLSESAIEHVARLVEKTIPLIATGLFQFDPLGRLAVVSRYGPSAAELGLVDELFDKCAEIVPIVRMVVSHALPQLLEQ